MSNVEQLPVSSSRLSEFEALVAAAPGALEAIPGAVYVCDAEGWLVRYNREAALLWGREPSIGQKERFCGSHRLFLPDGTPLPHADCPMAAAVRDGTATRSAEVVMERPDGSRITALVNIRALIGRRGQIEGAINCFQDITARKRTEEDLRRKTKDLEDFFENSAVALHIVGSDGTILRANKAELDLLGYSADEYVGHHIAEFHADSPVIAEILRRLSCCERLNRYPARLRAKDGSLRHVLITSNARFEGGQFVNTRCFTVDVTELHHSEAARRETEGRLAATYNAATVGIAEADEDGRLVRVNDALCRIVGRTREQLLSMRFFDYTHEGDRAEDARLYARQVRGELKSYTLRKKAVLPDGALVYLDVFSSSVCDDAGRFLHGVRVLQDVTAAQQFEDRLRQNERHMRELLEALPAAVYTTDAAGRINFYNKAAVELAGRVPKVGDEWCVTWRLFWPDGTPLPHDQCPMAIALREDRSIRGLEAVAERPDGTRVPFMPYPTPLHDANGKLIGAINMLVDITQVKEAENRQKVLIDELNHRVKNTLATVQSLALQTARHSDGLAEFVEKFEARLQAVARSHDLLTKRQWQNVPLDSLVRDTVEPMTGSAAGRIRISGPPVDVSSRIALNVTIVLNELMTNAAKYGALSSATGSVSINWGTRETESGAVLSVDWLERDGPPATPPAVRGFGTLLMERCIRRDLDGRFELDFGPAGVSCRMAIPLHLAAHG